MNLPASLIAVAALVTLACAPSRAEPPALDRQARTRIVNNASQSLEARYIFPEMGRQAAAHIVEQNAKGAYDGLSTTEEFATRLTTDLQAITNDKHMRAMAPRQPGNSGARPERPASEGGVVRADILADNIGYLEILGFEALDDFRPPIDRAMAELEGVGGLIIDLRRNGGGDPQSVSWLISYFLDEAEPVHVNDFVTRIHGTTDEAVEEFWSSPTPVSLHGVPLYVLTSDRTFSAAEEFSYDIKVMGLGKTVGATTGGGANPGDVVALGHGIDLFVPDGRARNPITGTNWEGVGVKPDIASPKENALSTALQHLGVANPSDDIDTLSIRRVFKPQSS